MQQAPDIRADSLPEPQASLPEVQGRRSAGRLRGFLQRLVVLGTGLNLGFVAGVLILLRFVSEHWWFSSALTYMPRSPYLIPTLCLLVATFCLRMRRASVVNLLALGLIAGPIMGLQGTPLALLGTAAPEEGELRILSCNIQSYRPKFDKLLEEIDQARPDIVAFQECAFIRPALKDYYRDWHTVHLHQYYLASRFPVRLVSTFDCLSTGRVTAVKVEVTTPQGTILINNLHPTSPRPGLTLLRPWSFWTGTGVEQVGLESQRREAESRATRKFADSIDPELPSVCLGDFNMPNDSTLFRRDWGDLQDAFALTNFGYGYSSPCDTQERWPNNCPWLQVDHILASPHWEIRDCRIGRTNGSDHRLIVARLKLRAAKP